MLFSDRLKLTSRRDYTDEGFLKVPARISRTGIQEYLAVEVGLSDREPNDIVKVYRPPEEVFSEDSLNSFVDKPVTDDHPPELVNAQNFRKYAVGSQKGEITQDGMFVTTELIVNDAEAIKKIEGGKVELSNGYLSDIEWTPGVTPDGESYDAIQTNIRGNHIAIVTRGRAGHACRVADTLPKEKDEVNMAKITIDGVDYEVTDQAAQAVSKLQARVSDAEKDLEEKDEEMQKEKDKAKAKEDTLKEEVKDAKAKILSDADINTMVADRAKLLDTATKLCPELKFDDMDSKAIKAAVVADKCQNVQMDSASEAYLEARFDHLVENMDTGDTSVNDHFKKQVHVDDSKQTLSLSDQARQKAAERNRNAWKKGDK